MYIKSITTGHPMPAVQVRSSKWRRFFHLPYVLVAYFGTNLSGPRITIQWFKPSDIGDYYG